LAKPSNIGQNISLTSVIKQRTLNYKNQQAVVNDAPFSPRQYNKSDNSDEHLSKSISSKLEDGNVRAALRLLLSDDKLADNNDDTFAKLKEKHPAKTHIRAIAADPSEVSNLQVEEKVVLKAIRSFPAGSAGGPDGFRPQHLLELITCKDTSAALLSAVTALVNMLLRGRCAQEIVPYLFGGNLTALVKKTGGIRPIAVGYFWRRLTAKCANTFAAIKLASYFSPIQLGVGVPGGCEAAIHACRRYMESMPADHVIVKLDFSNAFNCIHRDAMLHAVRQHIPEIYSFCHLAYNDNTVLKFGNSSIMSQEGCQQGDPLGPLLFCVTIQPMLQSLSSDLVIGYMDDITLGGPESTVASDVSIIKTGGEHVGIHLNIPKCEQITKRSGTTTAPIDQFVHVTTDNAMLLGAPLSSGTAMTSALEKRLIELNRASSRLRLLTSHDALVLLRASCGAPKLLHTLRASPCVNNSLLLEIDFVLRQCLCDIANVNISDNQWIQASLPVSAGGLGVRSVSAIALSAFLASESSTQLLQTSLLERKYHDITDYHLDRILAHWRESHHNIQLPTSSAACKQSSWDKPLVEATYAILLASQPDEHHRARLLAASAAHSGDWLNVLPISACGLRLDDSAIRIAVGLRLGSNICEPHQCVCGSMVNARGNHGLSCKRSSGRTLRHNYINDIIYHSLLKAGLPSTKEPAGLSRTDGKRPDGITNVPWQSGKSAVWDVTVADTLADSYLSHTSVNAAAAAELATTRKERKYTVLSATHTFIPIAFESLGPVGSRATRFLKELGRRLTVATDNPLETSYLFQRVSIALQRFNAICVMDSFGKEQIDNDMHI
jgi:hypothetical protein